MAAKLRMRHPEAEGEATAVDVEQFAEVYQPRGWELVDDPNEVEQAEAELQARRESDQARADAELAASREAREQLAAALGIDLPPDPVDDEADEVGTYTVDDSNTGPDQPQES